MSPLTSIGARPPFFNIPYFQCSGHSKLGVASANNRHVGVRPVKGGKREDILSCILSTSFVSYHPIKRKHWGKREIILSLLRDVPSTLFSCKSRLTDHVSATNYLQWRLWTMGRRHSTFSLSTYDWTFNVRYTCYSVDKVGVRPPSTPTRSVLGE